MIADLARLVGGYAMSRRDLTLLYAALFLSFLGASLTFPIRMLYAQAHGASPVQLGLLAASFLVAPLVAQFPMGWLVDRWGRVPVLLVGLIVHPILAFLYIPLNAPVDLIVLRFLEGVSVAAIQPAVNAYVADVTPPEHRSEAYGALGATMSAGMMIGPFFGGLIGQYFGFSAAFLANVAIEIPAILLVVGRVREPRLHLAHHESLPSAGWRDLFSVPLVGVYAAFFAFQVVMGVLGALWAIWIHGIGGSYTYIGLTFTVFGLPQIFLGARAGRIADRFGRAPFLLASGILVGLIYASYGWVTNLALILVLGVLEGSMLVFQQPIMQGLTADASPVKLRGRVQGVIGVVGACGGAISSFIALPLYHVSLPIPFVMAGGVMIAGSLVAATGAVVYARRRGQEVLLVEAAANGA